MSHGSVHLRADCRVLTLGKKWEKSLMLWFVSNIHVGHAPLFSMLQSDSQIVEVRTLDPAGQIHTGGTSVRESTDIMTCE